MPNFLSYENALPKVLREVKYQCVKVCINLKREKDNVPLSIIKIYMTRIIGY